MDEQERMEEQSRTLFKGMTIKIPKNLKFTKLKYSVNSSMKTLIGDKHKISEVYENGNLRIHGWSWDQRDFQSRKPSKKIPIAHFDPKELVT